ncbi:DUF4097 domain-containing protein [Paenibacillus lemnae]|uniref:DUF4097 domain-containing protein n=2 Tax=Paenibacillus lemnae TaxID=1330551 RepID=A0A848MDT3_PAELE|nr:DUF4097 domain-containing protein [Paenibacillus lemnae]
MISRRRRAESSASVHFHKADRHERDIFRGRGGFAFGLILILGGALLILLHQKPAWLQTTIRDFGTEISAAALILIGLFLGVKEPVSTRHTIKIGRYTAALLLIVTGGLLLADEWRGTDHIFILLSWWPSLFVILGLEYLARYTYFRYRRSSAKEWRFRPDIRGMLLCLFAAGSFFFVSQQEHFLHLWNRVSLNLTAAGVDYSEEADNRFLKPLLEIPVDLETSRLTVDQINGDIMIQRADIDRIRVRTEVWVDQEEPALAEAIAEQSVIEGDEGSIISIQAKGKSYGQSGKRQPRMNLDITIPDDRRFDMELRTMNGAITLLGVEAIRNIELESGNGPITLSGVYGDVTGKTLNGNINIRNVNGNVKLSSNSGSIQSYDVTGNAVLTTQVGNITANRLAEDIEVKTKNGNISLAGVRQALKAESLNGAVDIRSGLIGGAWDVYSAVGEMVIHIPLIGDYSLEGTTSYGTIFTDIPFFRVEQKKVTGRIGSGDHSIKIEGNSNLNIYRSYPDTDNRSGERGQIPLPY